MIPAPILVLENRIFSFASQTHTLHELLGGVKCVTRYPDNVGQKTQFNKQEVVRMLVAATVELPFKLSQWDSGCFMQYPICTAFSRYQIFSDDSESRVSLLLLPVCDPLEKSRGRSLHLLACVTGTLFLLLYLLFATYLTPRGSFFST